MVTRSAAPPPPPKWSGKPPPSVVWVVLELSGNPFSPSPVVRGLVSGNPPPSFSRCCGWESGNPPSSSPPVVWGLVGEGIPSFPRLWCGVWWVGIPLPVVVWGLVVVKLLYCAKPYSVGERFCSETLGCPFKCFGRPWRFLLGTLLYRPIKSVLMTSRPPIID